MTGGRSAPYEEAKRQVRDGTKDMRLELARSQDVRPEILYYLAADTETAIRREVAANPTTPAQGDFLLAKDSDDNVRCRIARKVAQLAPTLSADEVSRLGWLITRTLTALANDQLVQVRRILAESLSAVDNVEISVIERLARDDADVVAIPVLERSPLLTDEFLIELIQSHPAGSRLDAIARRANVTNDVSDAIVATNEEHATTVLLANTSAQIREETLDALIDDGMGKPDWHPPLVDRPVLSRQSVLKLAEYVAGHLLSRLTERRDIDPATAEALAETVRVRLAEENAGTTHPSPEKRAAELHRNGRLDRQFICDAVETGDREFAIAGLAERSGIPNPVVRKIVNLASPNGIVAIAWKAGFDMTFAKFLQVRLARIEPDAILAAGESGGFPQTPDEMEWQLELFEN